MVQYFGSHAFSFFCNAPTNGKKHPVNFEATDGIRSLLRNAINKKARAEIIYSNVMNSTALLQDNRAGLSFAYEMSVRILLFLVQLPFFTSVFLFFFEATLLLGSW